MFDSFLLILTAGSTIKKSIAILPARQPLDYGKLPTARKKTVVHSIQKSKREHPCLDFKRFIHILSMNDMHFSPIRYSWRNISVSRLSFIIET